MLKPAHLTGGPLDGHLGEAVDAPPVLNMSVGDRSGFIYRLAGLQDGVLQYRYDAPASRTALVEGGVAPSLAAFAVDAPQLLNGTTPDPDHDGITVPTTVHRYADRWELWAEVGGVSQLVEKLPREAFPDDDTDGLKQWVEASVQALATEAMKG